MQATLSTLIRQLIRKNPLFIVLIVLTDIAFVFLYGLLDGFFFGQVQIRLVNLLQGLKAIQPEIAKATFESKSLWQIINSNIALKAQLNAIIIFIALFMILLFILYCILQGISWAIASRMNKVTGIKETARFLKTFALVNIPIFALFYTLEAAFRINSFLITLSKQAGETPAFDVPFFRTVYIILLAALIYFSLAVYSEIYSAMTDDMTTRITTGKANAKNSASAQSIFVVISAYKQGIIKALTDIRFLLLSAGCFLLVYAIHLFLTLFNKSPAVLLMLGFLLLMPAIAFTKILLVNSGIRQPI